MAGYLFYLIIIVVLAGFITYIVLSNKKARELDKETWSMKLWNKPTSKVVASSVISILFGLLFGCLVLTFFIGSTGSNGKPITFQSLLDGIQIIFGGIFSKGVRDDYNQILFGWNGVNIGNMLFNATPLILTGLSVAVAFKTGLFNIGTPGQYLIGIMVTFVLALSIPSKDVAPWLIWIIAFIGGILGGALWGAIPGFFKAYMNVNEVITCIMTNWIAANFVTFMFDKSVGPLKYLIDPSGTKNNLYIYKTSHNGVETSKMFLDKIFAGSQVNGGIIVAVLIALVIAIMMSKTTLGYELKACGSNKHAAKYAGINEKKNIVLSMVIAGGLAGAGASLYYLAGNTEFAWETYQSLPSVAFNGIPVALLAVNNPVGVIFSAIFMAYLEVAGTQMKYMTGYNEHITSIISAVIVYFSAFSLIIKGYLDKKRHKKKEQVSTEVVTDETTKIESSEALPLEKKEVEE